VEAEVLGEECRRRSWRGMSRVRFRMKVVVPRKGEAFCSAGAVEGGFLIFLLFAHG
jgi:hypothetical protein